MQSLPFQQGERVVLQPVAVMEIMGIGPRSSFARKDSEMVVGDLAGFLREGSSPLKTIAPDDIQVYALRFLDSVNPFILLPVTEAEEQGLRRILSSTEASELLSRFSSVKDAVPPLAREFELSMEAIRARNDPWRHLLLLRILFAHKENSAFTNQHRKLFDRERGFLVEELSLALAQDPASVERDLLAQVEGTLKPQA